LRLEPHQHPLVVKKVSVQYWSLNGAQGKYNSPTWVNFVSNWSFVMPLAALLGLACALTCKNWRLPVCVGYLFTGSALTYVLLSIDWPNSQSELLRRQEWRRQWRVHRGGRRQRQRRWRLLDNALEVLIGGTGTVQNK
jgi:hypothetical protein